MGSSPDDDVNDDFSARRFVEHVSERDLVGALLALFIHQKESLIILALMTLLEPAFQKAVEAVGKKGSWMRKSMKLLLKTRKRL